MERAALERLQQMIDDEVKERFPEGAVRRVMLLQYGDDPVVEPGEVRVRVLIPKDYGDGLGPRAHDQDDGVPPRACGKAARGQRA